MKIDLTSQPGEAIALHLNGRLVAEVFADQVTDRDALAKEVREARTLRALKRIVEGMKAEIAAAHLIPDHLDTTPAAKTRAFVDGLADGLERRTVPHPLPGVPDTQPEHGPAYTRGYSTGDAIARCLKSLTSLQDGGRA